MSTKETRKYVPSEWVVTSNNGAVLAATRLETGETFTGTPQEFKALFAVDIATDQSAILDNDNEISQNTFDIGTTSYKATPAFVRSIGASNAVAAAMEAFSAALPKNGRINTPVTVEQGTIRLDARLYTLEKPIVIDISNASESRFGLTIEGVGSSQTILYVPGTASPATFKDSFGDNIWRAIRFKSNDTAKFNEVKLRGFRLLSYAKQNGDNSTPLVDACRWLDFENMLQMQLNDVVVYQRSLTALSYNQYGFSLKNCYYSALENCTAFAHIANTTNTTFGGSYKNQRPGVGFRFENNNALVVTNPLSLGHNLGFHLINEDGILIVGGATEAHNASFFFDGDSSNNKVVNHRGEWNQLANNSPLEPGYMYFAKFSENSSNNIVELGSAGICLGDLKIDASITQSNKVVTTDTREYEPVNLLSGATWNNTANVSNSVSVDVPPKTGLSSVTQVTTNGNFNTARYTTPIKVPKGTGSVIAEIYAKVVSGYGMLLPQIGVSPSLGNTRLWGGVLAGHASLTLANKMPTSIAIQSVVWSANRLTILTKAPHFMQKGLVVKAGAAWGSIAADTSFVVEAINSPYSLTLRALGATGDIADPGSTALANLMNISSDSTYFLGAPDITSGWQKLKTRVSTRRYVSGYSLNGSNIVTVTLNSAIASTTGVVLNLYGFSEPSLNVAYTIGAGDASGVNITLNSLGAKPGLVLTNKAVQTGLNNYGWVEVDTVSLDLRTLSANSGQSLVSLFGGEAIYME